MQLLMATSMLVRMDNGERRPRPVLVALLLAAELLLLLRAVELPVRSTVSGLALWTKKLQLSPRNSAPFVLASRALRRLLLLHRQLSLLVAVVVATTTAAADAVPSWWR